MAAQGNVLIVGSKPSQAAHRLDRNKVTKVLASIERALTPDSSFLYVALLHSVQAESTMHKPLISANFFTFPRFLIWSLPLSFLLAYTWFFRTQFGFRRWWSQTEKAFFEPGMSNLRADAYSVFLHDYYSVRNSIAAQEAKETIACHTCNSVLTIPRVWLQSSRIILLISHPCGTHCISPFARYIDRISFSMVFIP